MRVSTHQFQQQAIDSLLQQQGRLGKTQLQISSGKRLLAPSDDPVASARILSLKEDISKISQYNQNIDFADQRLSEEETIVNAMVDVIYRVQSLMVRGGSDALGTSERESIMAELSLRRDELVNLANSKDKGGEYIFSGFKGGAKPFVQDVNKNWVYLGDQGQRKVQIGVSAEVAVSDPGYDVCHAIRDGNGHFVTSQGASNTGEGIIDAGSVTDPTAYVEDTYTITLLTNSSGELAYNIQDLSGNFIVPTPPADPILNAEPFNEGADINFQGIRINIKGLPNVGDIFTIAPSTQQSVFTTLDNAIEALGMPDNPRHNAIGRVLTNLNQILDNFTNLRSKIGARMNLLDTEKSVNENTNLLSQKTLSAVEDLDFTQAVSDLTLQATTIQAAQQSYLRIQGLSLFNLL